MKCSNCTSKDYIIDRLKKAIIADLYHQYGYSHNASVKQIDGLLSGEQDSYLEESMELAKGVQA